MPYIRSVFRCWTLLSKTCGCLFAGGSHVAEQAHAGALADEMQAHAVAAIFLNMLHAR